jgi:Immunity protein 74
MRDMILSNIGNFLKGLLKECGWKIDATSELIRIGRDEYKYVEGEKKLVVYIEMGMGSQPFRLYCSSIDRWLPPHENEEISDVERQRIASRIADCLSRHKMRVTVQ